ncbi:MAG: 3-oxoacyl-ACP reductase FabG [Anaerolineales bacterium]|nr:3-oxoacyl-ACP reductase FabG [Anaerolineales bacterium]
MQLKDRVAAVTGSGRGIGRVIAIELARAGAKLVVSDMDGATAEQTAKEIAGMGFPAVHVHVDVTKPADAKALTDKAVEAFGRLDILVNNAGIYPSSSILDLTEQMWDLVVAVNLKGTFLCSQAAVRQMIEQGAGVVINIATVDAKMRTTGNAHYAAAKAGVISFTRTLACEMAPHNVRVNAVAPGWVETEALLNNPERYHAALKLIPLNRLGKPEDVASAVLYLVSDAASYITGEILDVNGGMFMD